MDSSICQKDRQGQRQRASASLWKSFGGQLEQLLYIKPNRQFICIKGKGKTNEVRTWMWDLLDANTPKVEI